MLADQSTTPSYFAEASTSYNDGGGGVRIERSGTGEYAEFGDIAEITATRGNVQVVGLYTMTCSNLSFYGIARVALVTSLGAGNERCTLGNFFFEAVGVNCFDPASGGPVDAAYSVLVWVPQAGDPGAWPSQPRGSLFPLPPPPSLTSPTTQVAARSPTRAGERACATWTGTAWKRSA